MRLMLGQVAATLAFGLLMCYVAEALGQRLLARAMRTLTYLASAVSAITWLDTAIYVLRQQWDATWYGRVIAFLDRLLGTGR